MVQVSGVFICESFNHTSLPTASTLPTLESREHVETLDGMYSCNIFPLEYGYLYMLICESIHELNMLLHIWCFELIKYTLTLQRALEDFMEHQVFLYILFLIQVLHMIKIYKGGTVIKHDEIG
jgi:hypothetical protein